MLLNIVHVITVEHVIDVVRVEGIPHINLN